MKLTDLNIDCLEAILECLEIGDLLNAADACRRLHHAANHLYLRIHGEKPLIDTKYYAVRPIAFAISNLKIALQLLRCFGHLVSHTNFTHKHCSP